MKILEVSSKEELMNFIRFQRELYSPSEEFCYFGDKYYLDFFSNDNPSWETIKHKLFYVTHNSKIIGRIAYFFDKILKKSYFGYFECYPQLKIARLLMEKVKSCAQKDKQKYFYGPINTSFMYEVGILKKEFNNNSEIGFMDCKSYYFHFFERLNLKKIREVYAYLINVNEYHPRSIKCSYTIKRGDVANKDDLIKEIHDLVEKSFINQKLWLYRHFSIEEYKFLMNDFIRFIDPNLILLIYDKNKLIGVSIVIPNYCDLLKQLTNRNFLKKIFNFIKYRKIGNYRLSTIAVDPDYSGKGVGSFLMDQSLRYLIKRKAYSLDYSWVDPDNIPSQKLIEKYGGKIYKKYVVFRG